ncbi:hypothetical protein ES703_41985 [subsurface metagenome]
MFNRFYSKTIILAVLVALVLGFGVTGALCIEPPGGGKFSGKGISAVLTLSIVYVQDHAVVVEVLVSECGDVPFVFGPYVNRNVTDPSALLNITEAHLLDMIVGIAPPGCFSTGGGEDLGISRVTDFYNATTYELDPNTGLPVYRGALGANVSLQAVSY